MSPALLTGIAAILAAVAWPLVILIVLVVYRKPIGGAAQKIPAIFDRVQSFKIGALEAELERVVSASSGSLAKGNVTPAQVTAAAKIESQASDLGLQQLLRQLDRLCLEYDTIRNTMSSGYERTSAMTNVLIKMRTLAPSTASMIEAYKTSRSPGSRLAAVAMMQMEPQLGDLKWLQDRFYKDNPFIFYHSALALKNIAIHADEKKKRQIAILAKTAQTVVEGFTLGVPDPDTIEVLSSIQ